MSAAQTTDNDRYDARSCLDRAVGHLHEGEYDAAESYCRAGLCLRTSDDDVRDHLAMIGRVLCTMR